VLGFLKLFAKACILIILFAFRVVLVSLAIRVIYGLIRPAEGFMKVIEEAQMLVKEPERKKQ